eukprot:5342996-Amphidinium_carterae.2
MVQFTSRSRSSPSEGNRHSDAPFTPTGIQLSDMNVDMHPQCHCMTATYMLMMIHAVRMTSRPPHFKPPTLHDTAEAVMSAPTSLRVSLPASIRKVEVRLKEGEKMSLDCSRLKNGAFQWKFSTGFKRYAMTGHTARSAVLRQCTTTVPTCLILHRSASGILEVVRLLEAVGGRLVEGSPANSGSQPGSCVHERRKCPSCVPQDADPASAGCEGREKLLLAGVAGGRSVQGALCVELEAAAAALGRGP